MGKAAPVRTRIILEESCPADDAFCTELQRIILVHVGHKDCVVVGLYDISYRNLNIISLLAVDPNAASHCLGYRLDASNPDISGWYAYDCQRKLQPICAVPQLTCPDEECSSTDATDNFVVDDCISIVCKRGYRQLDIKETCK